MPAQNGQPGTNMKSKFSKLLPIYAARERRALRHYHEQNLAYESAFADEMEAALQHVRLQAAAQNNLTGLLETQVIEASDAQCLLGQRTRLQLDAQSVNARLPQLSQKTHAALELSQVAKRAYKQEVQTHFKMNEVSCRVSSKLQRHIESVSEQSGEEEFSAYRSRQMLGMST